MSPQMVYSTAIVLQGCLSWPIVSQDCSSIQTPLTDDQLSARPATLEELKSGDLLRDIPVEPFQYVYAEGWKHDHEGGIRGLFEMHRRERQDEHSHKLRLLIQHSFAEPVLAPVSAAAPAAAPPTLEDLKSGDLLRDIPVEPFQYVYTEGWKHDHESGARGLFSELFSGLPERSR